MERKIVTLFRSPDRVAKKYVKKVWARLNGRIPRMLDEDYNKHWNYTSFVGKTVLDLGADYGSTADYFLVNGAERVVAVEGDKELARKLHGNFGKDKRVVPVEKWIGSGKDVNMLIEKYRPDIVKVDIEGQEKSLLDVDVGKAKEWLIETHTEELHRLVRKFFVQSGFKVSTVEYGKTVDTPEVKVLIAKG
jgi:DNA-directed RNA polymerase beta subunit